MIYALSMSVGAVDVAAAVSPGGRARRLDLGGPGHAVMPAAVWLGPNAQWHVGSAALSRAAASPKHFEGSPWSSVGEGPLVLRERAVRVSDALGALVARVVENAGKELGSAPAEVRLTHPASWRRTRLDEIRLAAAAGGAGSAALVPEPIAAATALGLTTVPEGGTVAVYDFGGASFEATVLRRTGTGFEVAGAPVSRALLGGVVIDQRIIDHLGEGRAGRHRNWPHLVGPANAAWRQHALDLGAAVRRAKEELSTRVASVVAIPALDLEVQLTRVELDRMVLPLVDETVDVLEAVLAAAGTGTDDLAALYLVGGSSALTLVPQRVWERLGRLPEVPDEPATVATLGAVLGVGEHRFVRSVTFRPTIAAATVTTGWSKGCTCSSHLALTGDGTLVRVSDETRRGGGIAGLAEEAGRRLAAGEEEYREIEVVPAGIAGSSGALERRYVVVRDGHEELQLDRYSETDGRWFTVRSPERARDVVERLRIEPGTGDASRFFEPRVAADLPEGWRATERIEVVRDGTGHAVMGESIDLAPEMSLDRYVSWRSADLARPTFVETGRGTARMLGRHEAVAVTYRRAADGALTRMWLAIIDGRGYRIVVTLPPVDRLGLNSMARHLIPRAAGP